MDVVLSMSSGDLRGEGGQETTLFREHCDIVLNFSFVLSLIISLYISATAVSGVLGLSDGVPVIHIHLLYSDHK